MTWLAGLWRRLTAMAPAWCDPMPAPNRAQRRGRGAAALLDRHLEA